MLETETAVGFLDKQTQARKLATECRSFEIATDAQYRDAAAKLDAVRKLEKELEVEYKAHPTIVEAKKLQTLKGEIAQLLETARKTLKNGPMLAYERVQEEKREAEERRLAEEARKQRESDTLAAAVAAEKAGDKAEAEAILQEAAEIKTPTVVLEKTTPTVTRRPVRKFRMKNPKAVKADFLIPDEVAIGKIVRAMGKAAEDLVGGIEVYEELA